MQDQSQDDARQTRTSARARTKRKQAQSLVLALSEAPDLDLTEQPVALLMDAFALAFDAQDAFVLARLAADLERRISRRERVSDRARLLARTQIELWHDGADNRLLGAALYAVGRDQLFLAAWAVAIQHKPDDLDKQDMLERVILGQLPRSATDADSANDAMQDGEGDGAEERT